MPIQLLTPPGSEPVTLDEAKAHLRIDFADDDALIGMLISSARIAAETITRRALVTQQWKMAGDRFPSPVTTRLVDSWAGLGFTGLGSISSFLPTGPTGYEIVLPLPPLVQVDSITYIDPAGVRQTMAMTDYKVDPVSEPARVLPAYGKSWPGTRQEINAVEVTFTCGYGDNTKVPAGIKSWMLMRIGSLYENREEVAILNRGKIESLPFVDRLLDPYRVVTF